MPAASIATVRLLLAAGLTSPGGQPAPEHPAPIALTHVTVIDATGAASQPDMTVLVTGRRISAIGKSGDVLIPAGVRVIDGTGKFLIPGLWDMHVHTSWDRHFTMPLMVANGVTGVREMFGKYPTTIFAARREIAAGTLVGPRIVTSGPIVDGVNPGWPGSIVATNPVEGRAAVDDVKALGADFVKVYSGLDRPTYFAIAAEARRVGIPFAGHVPDAITVAEASDSGQRSIEHLAGVLLATSTKEAELRSRLVNASGRAVYQAEMVAQQDQLLASSSDTLADALFARFRANRTWQVPTLVVLRVGAAPADPALSANPALRYVPYALGGLWGTVRRMAAGDTSRVRVASNRRLFERELALVGRMDRDSVPILAGSDEPNPYTIPGFSLHDELGLLVRAGLTPMAALQAATRSPAVFLGALDSLGTVERGKVADLVLLDADPLADIGNTRRIAGVVLNGRWLDRSDLDRILADVAGGRWRFSAAGAVLVGAILERVPPIAFVALGGVVLGLVVGVVLAVRWRRRVRGLRSAGAAASRT